MTITKAVIPVAGKGTRFLPATKQVPKEMIPIINKPMIQYAVEEALNSGIEEIIFVTALGKEAIEKHFERNLELEDFLQKNDKTDYLKMVQEIGSRVKVTKVQQDEQLGLGHAILCAKDCIGDENFAVILGDDLVRVQNEEVTKQLIEVSDKNNNSPVIGVMEVDKSTTNLYGIVDGDFCDGSQATLKMRSMVEKPKPEDAPTNLATPGRYILTPEIFDCLEKIPRGAGGEYQLTDAINMLAREREVYAHIFTGDRFDTGNIFGYLDATVEFALRDEATREGMEKIIREKVKKYKL